MTTKRAPASTASVDLLRPHDRAGADEERPSPWRASRIASAAAVGAEGDLGDRQPTLQPAPRPAGRAVSTFLEHHDRE